MNTPTHTNIPINGQEAPKRAPTLDETRGRRRATVDRYGVLPYQIRPVLKAIRESAGDATRDRVKRVSVAISRSFPRLGQDLSKVAAKVSVRARDWVARAFGVDDGMAEWDRYAAKCKHAEARATDCAMYRTGGNRREPDYSACTCACHAMATRAAQDIGAEARDTALANAAMLAYDMGHPDVRLAINQLIPEGPRRPSDTPPGGPYDGHPMAAI